MPEPTSAQSKTAGDARTRENQPAGRGVPGIIVIIFLLVYHQDYIYNSKNYSWYFCIPNGRIATLETI